MVIANGLREIQALKFARKEFLDMAAINTVTLIGRVVRDIEVNSTTGKSVALIRTSG